MRFVPFTEENEWEGETWTFWLQLDGNEEELVRLYELLSDQETYTLDLNDAEDEASVERICNRAGVGYFLSDQLIMGKFTCPDKDDYNVEDGRYLDEMFYKGRIERYFKE